ncbi:MAG TPA: GNAT family N-acetyltransferase [Anaerolineaceae bacterium]|nr:GNAT family N-acetyltransferase [Anaerolineaceae bacterium]
MSSARVSVLSAGISADRDRWNAIGGRIDAYYTAEYASVFSDVEGGLGYAYLVEDPWGNQILYPFVRRDLTKLDHIGREGQGLFDIVTPYGYGGPAYVGAASRRDEMMSGFRRSFSHYCSREGIVSEFVRYHPLIRNYLYESGDVDIAVIRTTIVMTPATDEQIIMSRLPSKTRNMVRRATNAGVTVRFTLSPDDEELKTFIRLYSDTMNRRHAEDYYLFPAAMIEQMFERMSGSIALFTAHATDGSPVSSAIILHGGPFIHYHLSGSDPAQMPPGTNNLLLVKAAAWGASMGATEFHLGGGYSEGDSLFKFKASMSSERGEFAIGRVIHDPVNYRRFAKVAADRLGPTSASAEGFFPAYRAGR